MWSPGVVDGRWGTNQDPKKMINGRTKRQACLEHVLHQLPRAKMMGLVDCGLHEEGVPELDEELQAIWDSEPLKLLRPPLEIHVCKVKITSSCTQMR